MKYFPAVAYLCIPNFTHIHTTTGVIPRMSNPKMSNAKMSNRVLTQLVQF